MTWRTLVISVFVLYGVLLASAQDVDPDTIPTLPDAEHQCVMWGHCYYTPKNLWTNCPYTGDARRLSTNETTTEIMEIFERRCPAFFVDDEGNRKEDGEIYTCCSGEQILDMETSLAMAEGVLGRCPSCFRNMLAHICEMTCSPEQSRFMTSATDFLDDVEFISEITLDISEEYMNGTFDSCSNVMMPQTGTLAMELMCGGHSAATCNPVHWFGYMGDVVNNEFTPFQINFLPATIESALNPPILPCSQAYNGSFACSCVDCPLTCPVGSEPPAREEPCTVLDIHCISFSIIIVVSVIFILIVIGVIVYFIKIRNYSDSNMNASDTDFTRKIGIKHVTRATETLFSYVGTFSANNPMLIILVTSWVIIAMLYGAISIRITVSPIEIWASPVSQTRKELDYFNTRFGPFYRTSQVFFTVEGLDNIVHNTSEGLVAYGPAFNRQVLEEVAALQAEIIAIPGFVDVCYAPLRLGSDGSISECTIMSFMEYLGNDISRLNTSTTNTDGYEINYLNAIQNCLMNPVAVECLADWGGPVEPALAFGGFDDGAANTANTVVLSFPLSNHLDEQLLRPVMEWELNFITLMKEYEANRKPSYINLAFASERSIEDEIERNSVAEAITVSISYVLMFVYVTLALGKIQFDRNWFVNSKITIAISGICIVLLSIGCAVGFFGYLGVPTTLLALNVIPFFILSVGVDNIFIIVDALEKIETSLKTDVPNIDNLSFYKKRGILFGKTMGAVGPSILLSAGSQIVCFGMGSLSDTPAVKTFALFATASLIFLFIFQITTLVAILSLDYKRSKSGRLDLFCCMNRNKLADDKSAVQRKSLTQTFVEWFTPILLNPYVRLSVIVIFTAWALTSLVYIPRLDLGLDQEMALPEDSYARKYLLAVNNVFQMGPPVYWVLTAGLNFSNLEHQNVVCGGLLCNNDSLSTQIFLASQYSETTYLQKSANSWLDDYLDWSILAPSCCRRTANGDYCSHLDNSPDCTACEIDMDEFGIRPLPEMFETYVPFFLKENPSAACSRGGQASYSASVNYITDNDGKSIVTESNFMAYHTPLSTSKDYYESLQYARALGENITRTIREQTGVEDVTVFPYSVFYVYYEQYLTLWSDTFQALGYSYLAVLAFTFVLSGFNVFSTVVTMLTVLMTLTNMMGLMYFWSIELNAVSLVNLIISIGIAVEFCSHIVHAYTISSEPVRERTLHAMRSMGANIISGITLTNIPIVVLAWASSELFVVFFFRMFFGMVVIGFLHGFIFLPALLGTLSDLAALKF